MPERLGVPGFLAGRRAVDWGLAHQRWFTLYETRTLEVLSSDDYRARLNNPTHWTTRNQPYFRNFARSACITSASTGRSIGGALATVRVNMAQGGLTGFEAEAEKLAHRIAALDGVVGAHLGVAALDTTRVKTRETDGRWTGDILDGFGFVQGLLGAGQRVAGRRALVGGSGGVGSASSSSGWPLRACGSWTWRRSGSCPGRTSHRSAPCSVSRPSWVPSTSSSAATTRTAPARPRTSPDSARPPTRAGCV